mmetsp:Transcript_35380/g.111318  ORF Transcript_35380/g.111318 Transcript_35380/m.111318 type:complete len:238 (-) Transcript_35380:1605-2318(-)
MMEMSPLHTVSSCSCCNAYSSLMRRRRCTTSTDDVRDSYTVSFMAPSSPVGSHRTEVSMPCTGRSNFLRGSVAVFLSFFGRRFLSFGLSRKRTLCALEAPAVPVGVRTGDGGSPIGVDAGRVGDDPARDGRPLLRGRGRSPWMPMYLASTRFRGIASGSSSSSLSATSTAPSTLSSDSAPLIFRVTSLMMCATVSFASSLGRASLPRRWKAVPTRLSSLSAVLGTPPARACRESRAP